MRKKLAAEGISIPQISKELKTEPLKSETLKALYPSEQPLKLSASALNEYFKNQYAYFLKYVLRLQEEWTIQPDARSHGIFLHRIFEKVMQEHLEQDFDTRLQQAMEETSWEAEFEAVYGENGETQFARRLLLDTARATGRILAQSDGLEVIGKETDFGRDDRPFLLLDNGRVLQVSGKVDRIDRLTETGSLGVVDYKSGDTKFSFEKFFNGLNSQLPTYLAAIRKMPEYHEEKGTFGAMYLQMTEPLASLKETKALDEAVKQVMKSQVYKGLFLADQAKDLSANYEKSKVNLLTKEELEVILAYNTYLYQQAAEGILAGRFAINPYTENGCSIAPYVDQFKAITGFEANLHLGQARQLTKLNLDQYDKRPTGEKLRQAWIEKIKEELDK